MRPLKFRVGIALICIEGLRLRDLEELDEDSRWLGIVGIALICIEGLRQ
jgi:hypothetical protein